MKSLIKLFSAFFLLFFCINVNAISADNSYNGVTIKGSLGERIDNQNINNVLVSNISMAEENGNIVYRYKTNNHNGTAMLISTTLELFDEQGNIITKDQKNELINNEDKSIYYTYTPNENIVVSNYVVTMKVSIYNGDYYIKNYDIDINVYENNTYEITEKIDAYFLLPKHGIIRNIPIDNTVAREDGSVSYNKAKINGLRVNDKYNIFTSGGVQSIKIGDAKKTIRGEKHYEIKYYYGIGKDPLQDKDEFYFNLIGNEWDASIQNVSFNINMPKDFDESLVGVTTGIYGSKETGRAKYSTDGLTISGKTTGTLLSGEGLTIRIELEEGYFNNKFNYKLFKKLYGDKLYLLTPVLFLFIAPFIYKKHGKNELVESIEVTPPDGKNSLEVAYIYRTYARRKDIISLLVYLANKKYLKIESTESRNGIKGFKITKLKEYDGNNHIEAKFMEGLFKRGTEATKTSLQYSFYKTINKIGEMIELEENKVIDKKERDNSIYLYGLLVVITAIFMVLPLKNMITNYILSGSIIFAFIVGLLIILVKKGKTFKEMILIYFFGLAVLVIGILYSSIADAILNNKSYLLYLLLCIIILLYISLYISESKKRTPESAKILGQINGFKNFLETAEKERLEKLVNERPTYFYDILPFAYVLDVSDEWIKKFEEIDFQEPEWYNSAKAFDFDTFDRSINDTLCNSAPHEAPRVSSSGGFGGSSGSSGSSFSGGGFSSGGGGGFSGGGFSGGGSGGGGGSSW